MINIEHHPVWKNVNPLKKKGHLVRLFLASRYSKFINGSKVIGITGSVGKTTTAICALEILSQKFKTVSTTQTNKNMQSLDPIFNIPMTILRARPSTQKIILEMGIEYPGEMEFYINLIKPKTAIVTRISYQHTEFLGSLDEIVSEKGRLVEAIPDDGTVILNWDDPIVRKMAEKTKAEVIYYGTDPDNCHVWASNLRISDFKTVFELNCGVERVEVHSKLLGFHQIYPMMAAASLGINLGIPLVSVKKALEKVEPGDHRFEVFPGFNGSIILDDTFNCAPVALEEAIETLNRVPARRRVLVVTEMKELGKFSEKLHREIASVIFKNKIDLVFVGGGDAQFISDELFKLGFPPERMETNLQNPQIVSKLLKVLSKGDVVLLKGAHSTRLDEVVKKLIRKK